MTYVFYDFETTGINPAFDHPLQFAAIVTDGNLNELERVDIRCQVAPHILPSPYALHVTNIKPEQTTNKNLQTPFEFAQTLQGYTKTWAPACWLGYNTIAFDEPMMRQMFYQNLQPEIFATQLYGNTRLDVMKMVFAVYAEAPEILAWPSADNGKTSFKLDRLAPENGFAHENAHDALADVEATMFLFQKIRKHAPDLFGKLVQASDKTYVLNALKSYLPMEVTLRFGGNAPKTYQGCYCGTHQENSNTIGFADFTAITADNLVEATLDDVKQAIEGSPKQIRTLAVNKAETLRVIDNPSAEMLEYCDKVKKAQSVQSSVSEVLSARYLLDEPPNLAVEEQIYSSFIETSDKRLLEKIQAATWPERADIVNQLSDNRLRQLGKRLVAFYAPEVMSVSQQKEFKKFLNKRWYAEKSEVPWTTAQKIWDDLDKLNDQIDHCAWRRFYQSRINAVTFD